jgi:hypothetical protein
MPNISGYSSSTTFGLPILVHVTFSSAVPKAVHARARLDPSSTVTALPKFFVIVGATVDNKIQMLSEGLVIKDFNYPNSYLVHLFIFIF